MRDFSPCKVLIFTLRARDLLFIRISLATLAALVMFQLCISNLLAEPLLPSRVQMKFRIMNHFNPPLAVGSNFTFRQSLKSFTRLAKARNPIPGL
jgi:hypothetical protein